MAQTLYERVGGELAVRAVVLRLYRYILDDAELAFFFKNIDIERLKNSQVSFVSYAFGGPAAYTGKAMRDAHRSSAARGLSDRHFDLVAGYLAQAMRDLGLASGMIDEALATVAATRDDVLNR